MSAELATGDVADRDWYLVYEVEDAASPTSVANALEPGQRGTLVVAAGSKVTAAMAKRLAV